MSKHWMCEGHPQWWVMWGLGALQGLGLALNVLGTSGIAEHKSDTICLEFQMMV